MAFGRATCSECIADNQSLCAEVGVDMRLALVYDVALLIKVIRSETCITARADRLILTRL